MRNLIGVSLLVGVMVVGFQNCQNAKMSTTGNESSASSLGQVTPVDVNDNDINTPPPTEPPPANPPPTTTPNDPPPTTPPGHPPGTPPKDPKHPKDPKYPTCENDDHNDHADDSDEREYVCVLDYPGKSVKLGIDKHDNFVEDPGLGNIHNTAKHSTKQRVLCMTKSACLNIASQKFDVVSAEFRGYCKHHHNKHVVHISDSDLQKKIDEYQP